MHGPLVVSPDHPPLSKHLQSLVVSVVGAAAVVQHGDGATREGENGSYRVKVVDGLDLRDVGHGCSLHHYGQFSHHPGGHVNVMDNTIMENTT